MPHDRAPSLCFAALILSGLFGLQGCDKTKSPDSQPEASQAKADTAKPTDDASDDDKPEAEPAKGEPSEEMAAAEKAELGKPAPDFELTDLEGNTVKLSSHKGKVVVLEWFNPGCPFVQYAHGDGPLKDMAAKETDNGVVWLVINSGAEGKQGHGAETNKEAAQKWNMEIPVLLDESGKVGRMYGAAKTPHMYVIDEEGVLRYMGAIDNAPIGKVDGGGEQVNYVAKALANLRAGEDVETPKTDAYGCSVKYAS